jgi:hypothetical protein
MALSVTSLRLGSDRNEADMLRAPERVDLTKIDRPCVARGRRSRV